MTIKNDKERVCAYLDNQLTTSEKSDFEKRLSEESHLQALLNQFKEVDQAFRQANEKQNMSPVPDSVLSLLQPEEAQQRRALRPWLIAASVAVIAFIAVLTSTQSYDDIEISMLNALDKTPSSNLVWLNEKKSISMLITLSFQHINGQYCREFVLDRQGQATRQIACKDQQWIIELKVPTAPLRVNEAYIPATEATNAQVEDYLNQSMLGDGMDQSQEQTLISQKWQ